MGGFPVNQRTIQSPVDVKVILYSGKYGIYTPCYISSDEKGIV